MPQRQKVVSGIRDSDTSITFPDGASDFLLQNTGTASALINFTGKDDGVTFTVQTGATGRLNLKTVPDRVIAKSAQAGTANTASLEIVWEEL